MTNARRTTSNRYVALTLICLLFAALSAYAINWGLPSRDIDNYLFGSGKPWSGEKIHRLAHADEKFDKTRGADVDADPIDKNMETSSEPILLTGSDEDIAKIYLRYRLYTYQPDEMITMMSLAGMSPGSFDFDPRLYQYGGLFIYPVGALIKLCDVLGLIDVRSDVVYYLEHPDEFGKFYIVARAYAAAWGLVGVIIVFAIARRLAESGAATPRPVRTADPTSGGTVRLHERNAPNSAPTPRSRAVNVGAWASDAVGRVPPAEAATRKRLPDDGTSAGLLAAALFTLMPVVVCMAHEAKPHLPGAVLMLAAVLFAMRYLDHRTAVGRVSPAESTNVKTTETHCLRDWWLMCLCCGAAFGMVLSSWPIFVLIPLVAWLAVRVPGTVQTLAGKPRPTESTRDAPPSQDAMMKGGPTGFSRTRQWLVQTVAGTVVGVSVYVLTNPYVLINTLFHREILESNLGNSFAMYEAVRISEGFLRVLELTIEGATVPVLVLGTAALVVAIAKRHALAVPLIITAGIFFCQFVSIGAGKPGEYGRFGIFPNTALAIGAACLLAAPIRHGRTACRAMVALTMLWCATTGYFYLANFHADTTPDASRLRARRAMPEAAPPATQHDPWTARHGDIGLIAEPAPYSCPPLPFDTLRVHLFRDRDAALAAQKKDPARWLFFWTVDDTTVAPQRPSISSIRHAPTDLPKDKPHTAGTTPISWANKPIEVYGPVGPFAP